MTLVISSVRGTWSDRWRMIRRQMLMIDSERAALLRSSLAADGYEMDIAAAGDRVSVTIRATGQACPDCLVPEDLMRGILSQALGVAADAIDITYPDLP
jgi:hypothetical protein